MGSSVLTLLRGRRAHLANLLEGLRRQTLRPDEIVIAWMGEAAELDLADLDGVPVRHLLVPGDPMPLAAARNRAAEAASGDTLIFLDVDCIPAPTLVQSYAREAAARRGLFLGEVLYLPEGAVAAGGLDYGRLDRLGRVHPSKPAIPERGVRREPDAGELWGLSFALARADWMALGGMDERFVGYGAEETDFAARVAAADLSLFWTAGARAYHQHHSVHVPPLHQFDHILRNATLFRQKHGRWCMDYWLGQFRDAGLIAWDEGAPRIELRRRPSPGEVAAARQGGDRLFS